MSKSYRNNPQRAASSESQFTHFESDRMLPEDAACLDWLFQHRYPEGVYCPKCKKVTKHYREQKRPSYPSHCGHHVHPMPGDDLRKLRNVNPAVVLGDLLDGTVRISAKQLESELGVTHKCAWRIFKQIRSMLNKTS